MHTILYVDDNQENLRAFMRLFRKRYTVLLAESGQEGLQLLHAHAPIPLIITDQRMPKMPGIEFLEQTMTISPDSIRMIITGFTDVQALIDAINTGRVYHYITKPWDEQELAVTIKRAIESYELKIRNDQLLVDLQGKNADLERSYHALQEAQEKLIQAEKMASIGRLASRIAHELRNPIQGIRMGMELIKQDFSSLPESDRLRETVGTTLQHIDQEILAANKIIQDLLEYAREMKFEYTGTDVNNLIEGVLFNLAEKIAASHVTVKTHYSQINPIIADGIRIRQAMFNLIQNGIEAMPTGGTLTLTTSARKESTVVISVQDTGCGIAPEHKPRMFEPFFTTKEHGVGLGMSIVLKIIEAHGGTITIDSVEGVGTTVTVRLPWKQNPSP
jgi:signal transduction histidine kinase